jgi:hypothetical protein
MINDADENDVDGNDQRPIVTGRRTGNKDHWKHLQLSIRINWMSDILNWITVNNAL